MLALKLALALALALALGLCSSTASAHDVPTGMRAHAWVTVEGQRAQVLVRLPLALLLNIDLPKKGPGYIDLAQAGPGLARALAATSAVLVLTEEGRRLAPLRSDARISLPSDRAFASLAGARALLQGPPLPEQTFVFWNQGYFDAWLEYPVASAKPSLALALQFAPGLRAQLAFDLRYVAPDGIVRAYEVPPGAGAVTLDPRWYQAAWTFTQSGFAHILDGIDHLLFIVCLILPFRRLDWQLAGVVTAFTVGHSITLIAAAYGLAPSGPWFMPLVELLIAASILYMAIDNAVTPALRRRWLVSALFGLVHGVGFAAVLQSQLQFAGAHLLLSLLAFNFGIELGQLLVLVLALPLLAWLYRSGPQAERAVALIVGLLIGHTAWHWLVERVQALREAAWPSGGATLLSLPVLLPVSMPVAVAAAASTALAAAAGVAWWMAARRRHRQQRRRRRPAQAPPQRPPQPADVS